MGEKKKNVNTFDYAKPKAEQKVIEYKQQELIVDPVLNEKDCVNFLKSLGYKLFKTVEM
jgi:hypothetical protein